MSAPASKKKQEPMTEEEQTKALEDAKNQVKVQAFYMKRNLDAGKLMDAMKNASDMISELRTSQLSPKRYYSLYMVAFDELRHLEEYLIEEKAKHGKKMAELYEIVQYAANVLPRLYLLVTVGSAYIKAKEAPAKDVLRDMVEMCRGVQHPTRGLFLRNYLSEVTKDKLPDVGCDAADGDVKDSVTFVLSNFTEMNKLWVRMNQGPARDREKRENERQELRILVGKNLARLSQLEGVDAKMYETFVLPRIVDQIVQCKDVMAQQYLMEVVIQVFPDEFHLVTLSTLLRAVCQLAPKVEIKPIVTSLIDRLAKYAAASAEGIPASINVFKIFSTHIQDIVTEREVPCADFLALEVSLLNLCLKCYSPHLEYVDEVLNNCCSYLGKLKSVDEYRTPASVTQISLLLTQPVDFYNDILKILTLKNFTPLADYLAYEKKKAVHVAVLRNVLKNQTILPTPETVTQLLESVKTLVKDEPDQPEADQIDKDDFAEEQNLVAAVTHLFKNPDPEVLFQILLAARRLYGQGGNDRVKHTLPPLVFRVLQLTKMLKQSKPEDFKKMSKNLFMFVLETVKGLGRSGYAESALRLYLQAAQAGFEETHAYEFLTQAFTIYEDEIADSVKQLNAMAIIVGTLYTLTCLEADNYDTLITKTAKHSTKLMKKPDQCRAVCMSSHLFWREVVETRDGKRVLECLQKALKIADTCMEATTNISLFVEILNQYLYYFEKKNEFVTVKYLSGLIALINTNLANLDSANADCHVIKTFYQNTINYINWKREHDSTGVPYRDIDIQMLIVTKKS